MSTEHKDGGSAFPYQALGGDGLPESEAVPGMTLRDWFAGQALAALVQNMSGSREEAINNGDANAAWEARLSYKIADAMLKARESSASPSQTFPSSASRYGGK